MESFDIEDEINAKTDLYHPNQYSLLHALNLHRTRFSTLLSIPAVILMAGMDKPSPKIDQANKVDEVAPSTRWGIKTHRQRELGLNFGD